MEHMEIFLCPFCDFSDPESYFLLQHVELCHPENGDSPFITRDEQPPTLAQSAKGGNTGCSADSLSVNDTDEAYVACPRRCGESLAITELPSHMELHFAEGLTFDETGDISPDSGELQLSDGRPLTGNLQGRFDTALPESLRNYDARPQSIASQHPKIRPADQDRRQATDWKTFLLGSSSSKSKHRSAKSKHATVRRLGASSSFIMATASWELTSDQKAELGPHAHEDNMPAWLRRQLEDGAKVTCKNTISLDGKLVKVETVANETRDIIPVLAQLCQQDRSVQRAFLCHPNVQHVAKMSREGGFCGYRNIQMMISFIQATESQGVEHFPGRIPSILRLQDLIESAWDKGINSSGRIETGGIKGTRKYIGTPEAQALFVSLGISCEADAFSQAGETSAYERLLLAVEQYFTTTSIGTDKVSRSSRPPIYFQHPGHSLTIVGFEKRRNGTSNLLVFDPMFKPSPGIQRLIGTTFAAVSPEHLLKAYRRSGPYLRTHRNFEMLRLTACLDPASPPEPQRVMTPLCDLSP